METAGKGNATESAVLHAFVSLGFEVVVPFGGGHPYDLAVHLGDGLFARIQCKTGRVVPGCIAFNSRSTDHGRGRLSYLGLADVFGVYFPPNRVIYVVPVSEALGYVGRLRLEAPRNNQKRGIRLAADYAINRRDLDEMRAMLRDAVAFSARESARQVA